MQRAPSSCSPPRGVAANCAAQRAAEARPKARPKARPNSPPKSQPSAVRKSWPIFAPEEQTQPKAQPNSPPRVRLTAAPLSLRRVCRRPLGFHLDFANAKRVKSLLRRAGDGFFARAKFFCAPFFVPPKTALRGRRPGDPGRTERYYVSLNQLGPVLRCAPARFIYNSANRRNS